MMRFKQQQLATLSVQVSRDGYVASIGFRQAACRANMDAQGLLPLDASAETSDKLTGVSPYRHSELFKTS